MTIEEFIRQNYPIHHCDDGRHIRIEDCIKAMKRWTKIKPHFKGSSQLDGEQYEN